MHPVVADSDEDTQGKTDYTITYHAVNCSNILDCSLDFPGIGEFPFLQVFILGKSRDDPEVIDINQRRAHRRARIQEMRTYLQALQILDLTDDLIIFDDDDDEDVSLPDNS